MKLDRRAFFKALIGAGVAVSVPLALDAPAAVPTLAPPITPPLPSAGKPLLRGGASLRLIDLDRPGIELRGRLTSVQTRVERDLIEVTALDSKGYPSPFSRQLLGLDVIDVEGDLGVLKAQNIEAEIDMSGSKLGFAGRLNEVTHLIQHEQWPRLSLDVEVLDFPWLKP